MRLIKYYKRPDRAEIVKLDKVATEPVRNIPAGWMLVSYPIHLTNGRRLNMWLDPKSVYIEWIREFKESDDGH